MTFTTAALLGLLVFRHRGNLARLRAGTEPKVNFRRKSRQEDRAGRVALLWLIAMAVVVGLVVGGLRLWSRLARPEVLTVGRYTIQEVSRAGTGHQRAERMAFGDGGKLLAVTCPRYHRLVIYRIDAAETLEPLRDLELDGKPVAVQATAGRWLVLVRPSGDQRHVEPGWWQEFTQEGEPVGDRVRVGFYPDDLTVSPDGRYVHVLTSGRGEGDPKKPAPALEVFERPETGDPARSIGRVSFDEPGDDPERLSISRSGRAIAVTLPGSRQVVSLDLNDPTTPRLAGRAELPDLESPYPSRFEDDRIVMPVAGGGEGVLVPFAGLGECVAATLPRESGLGIYQPSSRRVLGRLTLRAGRIGLSKIRPLSLAYAPERGLLAVSNRSGSVHLVSIRSAAETVALHAGD